MASEQEITSEAQAERSPEIIEEELFESKTIQLDLLDQLKLAEDRLEFAEDKVDELLKLNKELEKTQAVYIGHKNDHVDV